MQIFEKAKNDVQKRAEKMSDFLRMEYLEKCSDFIKEIETLKYCYSELARLYEKNIMYSEAIKYLAKLQEITPNSNEKIKIYLKEIEVLIKGGHYDQFEFPYKKAIKIASEAEGYRIRKEMINYYKTEAIKLEKSKKNMSLIRIYLILEKLLNDVERNEIRKRLLIIYKKLGKIKESIEIEKKIHWNI